MIITKRRIVIGSGSSYPNNFTFSLNADYATSAGVYSGENKVRTLWGNEKYQAGTYTVEWDGKDDLGNTIPTTGLHIEILRSNVAYNWDGVIGNTSTNKSGNYSDINRTLSTYKDMAITGTKMFICNGWYETTATNYLKDTTNLGAAHVPVCGDFHTSEPATYYCTTDGINVYWYGQSIHGVDTSWIWATKVSDNTKVVFTYGTLVEEVDSNNPYPSAIDVRYLSDTTHFRVIKGGLSVQTNGNFLFMGRGNNNILSIIHKTTGQLMSTVSINGITAVATDMSNGLWIAQGATATKYTVNSTTGAITTTGITLSGLSWVNYMKITPDGATIAVIDGGANQQVKGFNNTTGALTRTLGQQGGYLTNATVANDKFAFQLWPIADNLGHQEWEDPNYPFLSFEPSGKMWVGDVKNQRYLRYSADWTTYETQMAFLGATLNIQAHNVDNTRVMASGSESVEFAIDYSKTLDNGVNGSWKLSYNWFASLPIYYDHNYGAMSMFIQLPNGRTYATIENRKDNKSELFELVTGGTLRNTGLYFSKSTEILADGTIVQHIDVNPPSNYNWYKKALIGFTGNNPNWGVSSGDVDITGSVSPFISIPKDELDPYYSSNCDAGAITTSGKLISFDGDINKGWHLGGIKLKTDSTSATGFTWKAAPSTRYNYQGEYPKDGTFDIGNGVVYGGGDMKLFNGNNILYNYHGEFWRGTQTNYFNHYWENGLIVGIIGTYSGVEEFQAAAGLAGNVLRFGVAKYDNDTVYLFHGDEFNHSAVHRWSITGLSSIQVDTIALGTTLSPAVVGIDLMAGLNPPYTKDDTQNQPVTSDYYLPSGQFGWLQTPATNDGTSWIKVGSTWRCIMGTFSFDKRKPTDIYISHDIQPDYSNYNNTPQSIPTLVRTVTRDLTVDAEHSTTYNTAGATSWKLWGNINWYNNSANNGADTANGGGQFLEVLDNNGKIITRIYPLRTGGNISIMANATAIKTGSALSVSKYAGENRPLEIYVDSTGATYKYSDSSPVHTALVDPSANWQNPKTLRFYFWTWNDGGGRSVGVNSLRFVANH